MNRQELEQNLPKGEYLITPDGVDKSGDLCWWIGFDNTIEGEDEDGNENGVFIGKLKINNI